MDIKNHASVPLNVASNILRACAAEMVEKQALNEKFNPQTVFLHGTMGIGKSSIVHQMKPWLEEKYKKEVVIIDIRISAMQSHDVQGIPYNAETGEIIEVETSTGENHTISVKDLFFSTPSWWPKDEDKIYILFLDEFSNGSKDVQQAAYRLILDRTIQNGKSLLPNTMIVAAGNLQTDNTGAKAILPAAANRFSMHFHIDTRQAHKPFLDWGINDGEIHEDVISYINSYPSALCADDVGSRLSFERPRSWEAVSNNLKNKHLASMGEDVMLTTIQGAIGVSAAIKFKGFLDLREFMPNWDRIRSTGEFEVPDKTEIQFFVATPMAMKISDSVLAGETTELENLCNAAMQLPKEIRVVVVRALKLNRSAMPKILASSTTMKLVNSITSEI